MKTLSKIILPAMVSMVMLSGFLSCSNQDADTQSKLMLGFAGGSNAITGGPGDRNQDTGLDSIVVSPSGETIAIGNMQQFKATAVYSDGSEEDVTDQVTWGSSHPEVLDVDENGLGVGIDSGITQISAEANGVSSSDSDNSATVVVAGNVGLTINEPSSTTLNEGDTTNFTMVLDEKPVGDVIINVNVSNGDGSVSANRLVFTPDNWDEPQSVNITATDDSTDKGNHTFQVSFSIDSSTEDPNFKAITSLDHETFEIVVLDNDGAGIAVSNPSIDSIREDGSDSATFTVVLNNEPTGMVVVNVGMTPVDEANLDDTSLSFTSGNWNIPQTVTITGQDDAVDENGYTTVKVLFTIDTSKTEDGNYLVADLSANKVSIKVLDDDGAGLNVSEFVENVIVEGDSTTLAVHLNTEPTYDVVVYINSDDNDGDESHTTSLTFTPSNWDEDQTVTVDALENSPADESTEKVSYTFSVSSGDSSYDSLDPSLIKRTLVILEDTYYDYWTVNPVTGLAISGCENGGYVPTGDFDGELLCGHDSSGTYDDDVQGFAGSIPGGSGSCGENGFEDVKNLMAGKLSGISGWSEIASGGYSLISKNVVVTASVPTVVAQIKLNLNSSRSAGYVRDELLKMTGVSVGGGSVTTATANGTTASTEHRISLQVSEDCDVNPDQAIIIMLVTTEVNYPDVETEVTSQADGTNVGSGTKLSKVDSATAKGLIRADFLVTVDNSGSMSTEQGAVNDSVVDFYSRLADFGADFTLMVNTSDCEYLWGVDTSNTISSTHTCSTNSWNYLNTGYYDAETVFGSASPNGYSQTQFENTFAEIGVNGSGTESSLYFAEQAILNGGVVYDTRSNLGRSGANLTVIVISDEKDQYYSYAGSNIDPEDNEFINQGVKVYSVLGLKSDGTPGVCTGSYNGDTLAAASNAGDNGLNEAYYTVANATGGSVSSICSSNPSAFLEKIALNAVSSKSYALAKTPISSSIVVKLGSTQIANTYTPGVGNTGWVYDSTTNSIVLTGDIPAAGSVTVNIAYDYYQ